MSSPPRVEHSEPEDGRGDDADLTQYLLDLRDGRADMSSSLLPAIYDRLKEAARRQLRDQRAGHTLQPTALTNEVYLKLFDQSRVTWNDRVHFFALAARAMRQLLIDHARRRRLAPRENLELDRLVESSQRDMGTDTDILDLDDALQDLAELDERGSRVVELRFFGGLEMQQIAEVLDISKSSVESDWVAARAWLGRRLASKNP